MQWDILGISTRDLPNILDMYQGDRGKHHIESTIRSQMGHSKTIKVRQERFKWRTHIESTPFPHFHFRVWTSSFLFYRNKSSIS